MEIWHIPFMKTAIVASLLAGNALAIIGTFVVMRRVSFSGLTATQLAALGGVLGALVNFHNTFILALIVVFTGLLLLQKYQKMKFIPHEVWVGSLYVLSAALAVLILAKAPHGEAETLNIFFGNVLTLSKVEIIEGAVLLLIAVPLFAAFFHKWVWISFDRQSAEVFGIRVKKWDILFFAVMSLAMTFAIHIFGVLLAFAYLILPGAVSLALSKRIKTMFILLPVFTSTATLAGFIFSFHWDLPSGPFIAALLAVAAIVAGMAKLAKEF